MQVTLYDSVCTPCVRKPLWKRLRAKAAEKRVLITRIDVSKSKEEREKAMSHNMAMPFVVIDDEVVGVEDWLNS